MSAIPEGHNVARWRCRRPNGRTSSKGANIWLDPDLDSDAMTLRLLQT